MARTRILATVLLFGAGLALLVWTRASRGLPDRIELAPHGTAEPASGASAPRETLAKAAPEGEALLVEAGMTERALVETLPAPTRASGDVLAMVVDARGRPAPGVRVFEYARGPAVVYVLAEGWTNAPDGVATLVHESVVKPAGRPLLAACILAAAPIEVPFEPFDAARQPVRIELPPTGEVEVLIFDARMQPIAEEMTVVLEPLEQASSDVAFLSMTWASSKDGRALFPHVALGREVRAKVDVSLGPGWRAVEATGKSPVVAGARTQLELVLPPEPSTISARAVDEVGAPLANVGMETAWRVGSSARIENGNSLRTGRNGAFEVDVDRPWKPAERRELLVFTGALGPLADARALVDLSWELPPGETDLGDVRFERPRPIASGRVVDEAGVPVAGARVSCSVLGDAVAGAPSTWPGDTDLESGATTDERGRFEVRSHAESVRFRLRATHRDFLWCSPVAVDAGGSAVELVLAKRAARVEGSVILPDDVQASSLSVRYQSSTGSARVEGTAPLRADGTFEIARIAPGEVRVSIHIATPAQPVIELPSIEIAAGQTVRDERLRGIDLRGRVHVLTLRVSESDGSPVENGYVTLASAGPRGARVSIVEGEVVLIATSPAVDLIVFTAKDFVGFEVAGARSGREIVLHR